jgi:EAL domain-containing protein (putative c-di-GMP-specific phosphodiesterase class I)
VTLELTESLLISEAPQVADRLHALKALGVKLAIDDFGTGFSSLGYLQRLPIDIVKIDRSFIDGIDCLDSHTALVTMILTLSEMLGLVTVAEGVETPAQLETLRKLHCPIAQGYLFAKPLPEAAALAYLQQSLAVAAPR